MSIVTAIVFVAKLLVCAACAAAGALWILSAWSDRRLRTREAVLLGVGLLVLIFAGARAIMQSPTAFLALAVVVGGGALLLRAAAVGADRRLRRQMNEEDIRKYQTAVHQHPENPYAHSLLADAYRKTGELGLAAAEYEAALRIDPSLKQERHWLQWVRAKLSGGGAAAGPDDASAPLSPSGTQHDAAFREQRPMTQAPPAHGQAEAGRWSTGRPGERPDLREPSRRSGDPRLGTRLGGGNHGSEPETEGQIDETHE
jgi:tetratricopeptide (TPR) repeat protein